MTSSKTIVWFAIACVLVTTDAAMADQSLVGLRGQPVVAALDDGPTASRKVTSETRSSLQDSGSRPGAASAPTSVRKVRVVYPLPVNQ